MLNDVLDMEMGVVNVDHFNEMLDTSLQACIHLNHFLDLNRKARGKFEQVVVPEPLEDQCLGEAELLQLASDFLYDVPDPNLSSLDYIDIAERIYQLQRKKFYIYNKRVQYLAIDLLAAYIQNWLVEWYYHRSTMQRVKTKLIYSKSLFTAAPR